MSYCSDVLYVIEGLSFLLAWNPTERFSGIDALENAQAAKVFQRDLQKFEAFRSSDERGFESCMFLFLLLSHPRKFALAASTRAQGRLDRLFLWFSFHSVTHLICTSMNCTSKFFLLIENTGTSSVRNTVSG